MKAIQIYYNLEEIPEAIQLCMASVKKAYPEYQLITTAINKCKFLRAQADYQRLVLASENDYMVWCDNDLYIKEPIQLEGELPYFAHIGRRPDIFYFAVNGRSDLFKDALDKCYKGMPKDYREMVEFNKRVSQYFSDKHRTILSSTYYHIMAHKWSRKVWMNKLRQHVGGIDEIEKCSSI